MVDYNEAKQGYDEAKGYYDKAQACVDDASSPQCTELLKEGAKTALVSAGVNPDVADAAVECAATRDREACAKASAKLAAVYGCTAATGGGGYVVCSELAPILVDQMWPVIGPPLTATWDVALDTLEGVAGMLKGMAGAFGSMLGFGSNKPTWTEKMNDLRWAGADLIKTPMDASVDAVVKADVESQRSLGLLPRKVENKIGMSGPSLDGFKKSTRLQLHDSNETIERKATSTMTNGLRRHPGFGTLAVAFAPSGPNKAIYRFVDPNSEILGIPVSKAKNVLIATGMPAGWSLENQQGWQPNGFILNDVTSGLGKYSIVRDAYGMILAERTRAIKDAAFESVGITISRNVQKAEAQKRQPTSSSSVLLWIAALVGSGALAYRYRGKISKWVGR